MALPIEPTPKLNAKETRRFLKEVARDAATPIYWKPTPKIEEARRMAIGNAVSERRPNDSRKR